MPGTIQRKIPNQNNGFNARAKTWTLGKKDSHH